MNFIMTWFSNVIEFSPALDRVFAVRQRARISSHGDVVHALHEQQSLSAFGREDSTWPPDALAAAGGQSASALTNGFIEQSPAEESALQPGSRSGWLFVAFSRW